MTNQNSNTVAPQGQIYVCSACGKRSRDRYGNQKLDHGWDESCVLHSVLVYEKKTEYGRYRAVNASDDN